MSVAVEPRQRAALWDEFASNVSSQFSTRFEFKPLTPEPFAPEMEFHPGDGVAVSRGVMPALRLTNHGSSWPDPFFQVTRADQASVLTMEGRGTLRLAPGELVICGRRSPASGPSIDRTPRSRSTSKSGLFRQHIPDPDGRWSADAWSFPRR